MTRLHFLIDGRLGMMGGCGGSLVSRSVILTAAHASRSPLFAVLRILQVACLFAAAGLRRVLQTPDLLHLTNPCNSHLPAAVCLAGPQGLLECVCARRRLQCPDR